MKAFWETKLGGSKLAAEISLKTAGDVVLSVRNFVQLLGFGIALVLCVGLLNVLKLLSSGFNCSLLKCGLEGYISLLNKVIA